MCGCGDGGWEDMLGMFVIEARSLRRKQVCEQRNDYFSIVGDCVIGHRFTTI